MKAEYIAAEIRENVGIITLNNPNNLNSINEKMLRELSDQILEYDNSKHVRVIVLKGIEKSFAAGLDVKSIAANLSNAKEILKNMQTSFQSILTAKKPLIAAVSGFALGIGCEIVMCCDIVLATETARFGLPELSIGLLPCFGGCHLLTKTVGKAKAMDMILSGRALLADEAEKAGLVSRIVTSESLTEEYTKLAQRIASLPQSTVLRAKRIISQAAQSPQAELENLLSLSSVESSEFKQSLMSYAQKKPSNAAKA